jgi:hypothetical protein
MPSAVKLSDEFVEVARSEAKLMKRSIAGQVEYWASLGRTLEASGALSLEQVHSVLCGKRSVHELTPVEQVLYLEMLGNELESLDGSDTKVIEELEEGYHPVAGEDDQGVLVVRVSDPSDCTGA